VETPLVNRTIILGVTGSIAAYKAADLVSRLGKLGAAVHVVMTEGATKFVTPLTLATLSRRPVTVDLWAEGSGWQPGHIELADKADLLMVAPASANTLAQFARGLAPDALSSLYLACRAPVLLAPAMNGKMWEHPATQENVRILLERGHEFIGPESGMLACGYEGVGRLWPVDGIVERCAAKLQAG
jgi:phosphopantothenoylcysteine decarboxylase